MKLLFASMTVVVHTMYIRGVTKPINLGVAHTVWEVLYLEPLGHVGDTDVFVPVGKEASLELTRLIDVVDTGLLPGLTETTSPASLRSSYLILFLVFFSTQVLQYIQRHWLSIYYFRLIQILYLPKNSTQTVQPIAYRVMKHAPKWLCIRTHKRGKWPKAAYRSYSCLWALS